MHPLLSTIKPIKTHRHVKLHKDLTSSFQVMGNFVIGKNTKTASEIKGQSQSSPEVNIHAKLHWFLIDSLSSFCANRHGALTPTKQ